MLLCGFFSSTHAFRLSYEFVKNDMGGRHKLGCAMKNAERKERKSSNLAVSIPLNLLHIQACPERNLSLCAPDYPKPSDDDSHLTVSLALSAYVNGVRSLEILTSRVFMLSVSLPWVITSHIHVHVPLILCKIEAANDLQRTTEV